MESLGRLWYYLEATQGPHCCMSNLCTTENSSRGRDIWREVPRNVCPVCPFPHGRKAGSRNEGIILRWSITIKDLPLHPLSCLGFVRFPFHKKLKLNPKNRHHGNSHRILFKTGALPGMVGLGAIEDIVAHFHTFHYVCGRTTPSTRP